MKKRLIALIVALAILASAFIVVKNRQQSLQNLPKPQTPLPTVEAVAIRRGILEVRAHYLGSVEPLTKSDVSARITGSILSITKREGDTVRQGEVVITIDDRELIDRSMAVTAEMLSTRQRLAGAKSAYETQRAVYERDSILYKAGAISQEAFERSLAAFDSAKSAVQSYEEGLKGLEMNISIAKTQAGYAHITAPFSGVVSKRWAEPGDMATPGRPILTIEKTSPYKVLVQVPQEELTGIRPGTTVVLSNGGHTLSAKVNRVYPVLGKNLLATVEILLASSPFNLPSSATVGVDIITKRVEGFIVPEQAIVKSGQGNFVYILKDGVAHTKPVKLLGTNNGKSAVSGDLNEGQMVAVAQENKLITLTDGGRVNSIFTSEDKGAGAGGAQ